MPALTLQSILERWGPTSLDLVSRAWGLENGTDVKKTRQKIQSFLIETDPKQIIERLSEPAVLLIRILTVDGGDVEWSELERIYTQSAEGRNFDYAQKELRRRGLAVLYRTGGHGPVRRCLAIPSEIFPNIEEAFTPLLRRLNEAAKPGGIVLRRSPNSASNLLFWLLTLLEEHPTALDARGKPVRRYSDRVDAILKISSHEHRMGLGWGDVPLFTLKFAGAAGLAARVAGEWHVNPAFDHFCAQDDAQRIELFYRFWRAHFPYHDPMFAALFSVLGAMKPSTHYDMEQMTEVVRTHAFAPLRAGWASEGWGARRRDLFRTVIRPAYHLGLIELSFNPDETPEDISSTIGLTPWGHWALRGFRDKRPSAGKQGNWISVGSDFEIMAPGDLNLVTRRALLKISQPLAIDNMLRFKITKEQVREAANEGLTEKQALNFLRKHSRTPVPQNVAYNVREWILTRAKFEIVDAAILQAPSREAAQLALKHPAIGPMVLKKFSGKLFAVRREGIKSITKALQDAGWGVTKNNVEPASETPSEPDSVSFVEFTHRVMHVPASPDLPPERLWVAIDELRDLVGKNSSGSESMEDEYFDEDNPAPASNTGNGTDYEENLNLLRLAVQRRAKLILTVRENHGALSRSFRARPLGIFNSKGILSLRAQDGLVRGAEISIPVKDILSVEFI